MSKRLKQAAVAVVVLLVMAQFIRPAQANPPSDPDHAIGAEPGPGSGVAAVFDRSCRDCHSNATEWRWYARVAPLSWLMARGVAEGRRIVNFSEWTHYPPERQRALLAASCKAVTEGRMPGAYAVVRPDTKLSARDIAAICEAARAAATAAEGR